MEAAEDPINISINQQLSGSRLDESQAQVFSERIEANAGRSRRSKTPSAYSHHNSMLKEQNDIPVSGEP